jgi:hypothetical protein
VVSASALFYSIALRGHEPGSCDRNRPYPPFQWPVYNIEKRAKEVALPAGNNACDKVSAAGIVHKYLIAGLFLEDVNQPVNRLAKTCCREQMQI